ELVGKAIRENNLNRVVVAACSPLMHETTFRKVCMLSGLNQYLFQMANIREQCSWVTEDPELATIKAKAIISGAVSKARYLEPLNIKEVKINPTILVIGGGIAGIQAALECAEAGNKVILVEKTPSIGGHMAQFDKTFPTLDCSACILTPKMTAAGQHTNIRLMTYSEVKEIKGYVGNFKVKILEKAKYVDHNKCTGCGVCMEKCPYKAPNEFEEGLALRKAIYIPFPQAVPNKPVIDKNICVYFKTGKCRACEKFCEPKAINFEDTDREIEVDVGAIIVATGYDLLDPREIKQLGYKRYDNVYTGLEFERINNASGPTAGKIQLKDGRTPRSIAILHCIGSRDKNYYEYCSRVCCMYALKYAHLIKEKIEADVFNCYIDMRCFGKGYEEFYHRLTEEGVDFIRGKAVSVLDYNDAKILYPEMLEALGFTDSEEDKKKLFVRTEDTLLKKTMWLPVDMVILCNAITPRHDAKELSRLLNVSIGKDGFFLEKHPKLAPVSTATDGIFLAGACQGPKDIPDSVAQASAAAAAAISLVQRNKVVIESATAFIFEELCSGCKLCNDICPFSAITFDEANNKSQVNDALCKGCGTCVSTCPSSAIKALHFTDKQIFAEIEGLLNL
ncbi:MAG: CoB--CoM heterodisulfide reductase iron-sulfur subunit A family protein, partial [Deltaproteobacteria bacterium]|nr:CoB--CoM heterodisulfide reductase iron-sulfur subunit A family protein [Deltaproteobacteria bacterium]